jgi:hypothetical protein
MPLADNLTAFATRVGQEIKAVRAQIAGLSANVPHYVTIGWPSSVQATDVATILYPYAVNIPGNFVGSFGNITTPHSGAVSYVVRLNGATVGAIDIASNGSLTWSTSGGNPIAVPQGGRLTFTPPSNTSLNGVTFTIRATKP